MSATAAMPNRIGRFRLHSMLGRGAMGVVYLGHDEAIDRPVAIKLIRADLLDTEEHEGYLKRFSNEAKIAGRCVHANIVGLYDFALHEGNPYLVMEYVDGVGLQQFFPRGSRRPIEEVCHIALQVLDALHYAHARSIVHRDVKPANILMMPDLSLKITDFGISRLTSMELTATPLLIGTPSYMSPEQCLGSALDGRNDLFSLGCVLYELVAGERAFSGVNYTETIFSIVNRPHEPLGTFRDDLPAGFAAAIDRALAKNPDDRYASAAEFARVLDEIVRSADLRGAPPPVLIDALRPMGPAAVQTDRTALAPAQSEPAVARADYSEPARVPHPDVEASLASPPVAAPLGASPPIADDETFRPVETTSATPAPEAVPPGTIATGEPPGAEDDDTLPGIGPGFASLPPVVEPAMQRAPQPERNGTIAASPVAPARTVPPVPAPPPRRVADVLAPAKAQATVDSAVETRIAGCLATVLGPIAPLVVRRTVRPGMTVAALTQTLADHVRHPAERAAFLALAEASDRRTEGQRS